MAIQTAQIAVPSDGSVVTILSGGAINADQISIRNTGTVTVLLGAATPQFPLQSGEVLGVVVGADDTLKCCVKVAGTAGQVTTLALG